MKFEKSDFQFKIANIGRFTNLLIILNISLFVTSGLVKNFDYYFPMIAISLQLMIHFIITFPIYLIRKKTELISLFIALWISIYFTIASIIYLIQHNDFENLIK